MKRRVGCQGWILRVVSWLQDWIGSRTSRDDELARRRATYHAHATQQSQPSGTQRQGIPFQEVRCRECGETYRSIEYSHLQAKHDMDIDDYEAKHPDAPRICVDMLYKLDRVEEAHALEERADGSATEGI